MNVPTILALSLLVASPQDVPTFGAPVGTPSDPVRLDDVLVDGRSTREAVDAFVRSIASPAPRRGPARWHRRVCIGVANLEPATAQYMIDRIAGLALDLGLTPDDPGCEANFIVMISRDSSALAKGLVEGRRKDFFGSPYSGAVLGGTALRDFQDIDRPVRWWHVAAVVNANTGDNVQRAPGGEPPEGGYPPDVAIPSNMMIRRLAGSRLQSDLRDDLQRVVVIVDAGRVSAINLNQLSDYVAMVGFAQIDSKADTSAFSSILNLFRTDLPGTPSLTDWDRAYLNGLYRSERNNTNPRANRSAVAAAMASSLQRPTD